MKTILLTSILLGCSFAVLFAQSTPPRPPDPNQMLRQVQQMQRQDLSRLQQQQMNGWLQNSAYSRPRKKRIKNLHLFKIVYADSTQEQVMAHLEFTLVSHTLVIGTGKHRELSPVQTLYISRTVLGREIKGWASDSCWLFKTTEGKINAYTEKPDDTQKIVCIQNGDTGERLPCTMENVMRLVADNPQALQAAQRKKYYEAILIYNQ